MCASPAAAQAPLFGMQSWVNSQEVRQWLQTQIASEPLPSMRGLTGLEAYGAAISRHNSDTALPTAGQDAVRGPAPECHVSITQALLQWLLSTVHRRVQVSPSWSSVHVQAY